MRIKPFQALHPPAAVAERVASLPYDVLNSDEARVLVRDNARSFLRVVKPEVDLDPSVSIYDDAVYAAAAANFRAFQEQGLLVRDDEETFYIYRQVMNGHAQYGVVACVHVDDYDAELIKKHERTLRKKEDDRTRHVATINANAGPVFLTYRDQPGVDRIVAEIVKADPALDFVAVDGIRHTVWRCAYSGALGAAFSSVPCCYVADGHHRAASAARVARDRRAAHAGHTGEEEYNWFLAVLFPATQLRILPYNRLVTDLNGLSPEDFLARVREAFAVSEVASDRPAGPGSVSMYFGGRWYGLSWPGHAPSDPVAALDVSVLQDRLLAPILGIADPRQSDRIDFVGGIRGTEELVRRVDSGGAAVAFSMAPVTVNQLMQVSDAGLIMPPKSTWFEPKLRSGLLVHTLD